MEDINKKLHEAVSRGKTNSVKRLLKQGCNINQTNQDGNTPLHTAVLYGQETVIEYLLNHGADVEKATSDGRTPLHLAASLGHVQAITIILSHGANMDKEDKDGCSALYSAIKNGHLDVVQYFIRQGAKVYQCNNESWTPLHMAAGCGKLEVVKYLISEGARVNWGNNKGMTALHIAAQMGHLDVTIYLIIQGAEVNKGGFEGCTALHGAARMGHLNVTKYLIRQGAEVNKGDNLGGTVLHLTASVGQLEVTKYLISQGAEVNKGDNEGVTALYLAAQVGHLDVTKYLVSQGAEINKEDNKGRTVLQFTASDGHLDVTKYLVSQGADVNKVDDDGLAALFSAAHMGHLDVTKYLISQGAEVNKENNEGSTALSIAAHEGHLDVTKYLFSQGGDVNRVDNDGSTALHSAVQEGHLVVTKYLLAQGISVNMGNRNGYTPLHVAVMKGGFDIVKVLLEEGALVDVKNANGQTPLHLSSKKGSTNSSDILAMHAQITGILDQRDDEGLTAIHLATQNGHTPVVESLVSHGASLNIQSHDGKTSLHEAIKLSDHKGRKEQLKGRSKQISEDSFHHELSPEKALVLYLLDHGAKLDIRDGEGKLPVHYATDEVIRQEIFSRLPSIEMITRYRAEEAIPLVTVSAHVGNGGKQIELADLGISMSIPPGAVQEGDSCEITLTSIQDPPSIDSQGDESLACLGIRCDPPNTIFHQPVKIKIPHSAFIVNPDRVKPDIVCRSWDSVKDLPRTSRNRSSSSPEEPPYCRVYKKHHELYIGHCAEWWVLIPLEQQVIRHQLMCTPYIPETVERGKEIEVHLHVHADVPGMDTEVLHEEKHQSYRKAHRSVPFSITSHSGDVTVARDCEGKLAETKLLSLQQIKNRMSHTVLLKVPPMEDDTGTPFDVITITVTQSGNLGVSRSMAFVIRYEDEIKGPEFTKAIREIEGTFRNDLPDVDIQNITEKLSIDDFYDLGVALGFRIQQLDAIEYKRLKDRQEAIHEILITWKQSQPPNQNVKEVLLALLKSAETEAEKTKMTDITSTGDISDQDLLKLARTIKWTDFTEIGTKLGFTQNKLQNIKHKTLQNRKDANIQMLCMWKASQRSGAKATKTLKCIWESVFLASAENTDKEGEKEDEEDKEVAIQELEGNSTSPPEQRTEQSESVEPEDLAIIRNSDLDGDETSEDIDLCGGSPSTSEQYNVALPVKSLSLAWELGKALCLDDDAIVSYVAPFDSAAMNRLAWQLLNKWCKRVGSQEKTVLMTKLLQDYNIRDCDAGLDEISKRMCTTPDLLDLSRRLDLAASEILQVIMSTSVSFPPTLIRHIVLEMLQEWVRHGGTRQRLLEIAQAFHFNDAADEIATAMEDHPGFLDPFSHGIIDHDGGELKLDELDIRVSIPAGAISKGMRSVVTLSVPNRCSSKIPLKDGDVLITPVIECSFTQKLLKPATVGLPHCIHLEQNQDDLCVSLYTKLGPGTFGYRTFLSNSSSDFHISEDIVGFSTHHLQLWALSSSNVHGVQFTCEVFQLRSQKPTMRIHIAHPCNRYPADICRRQGTLVEPFYQVATVIKFSLESKEDDLKLVCLSDSEQVQETVPVRCLLNGECNTFIYELLSSHAEGETKSICLRIEQGTSTLAEQQIPISIEVKPDNGVSNTRGRMNFASDVMLEVLSVLVCAMTNARDLGFSH